MRSAPLVKRPFLPDAKIMSPSLIASRLSAFGSPGAIGSESQPTPIVGLREARTVENASSPPRPAIPAVSLAKRSSAQIAKLEFSMLAPIRQCICEAFWRADAPAKTLSIAAWRDTTDSSSPPDVTMSRRPDSLFPIIPIQYNPPQVNEPNACRAAPPET